MEFFLDPRQSKILTIIDIDKLALITFEQFLKKITNKDLG